VNTDPHPFFAMENRVMERARAARRFAYREYLKSLTPEQLEVERKRTQELLARSPYGARR
jgi:hypothetical protein